MNVPMNISGTTDVNACATEAAPNSVLETPM